MEMFQQMIPETPAHEGMKNKSEDITVVRTKLDYVRQFSTGSTSDSQQMFTIFWQKRDGNKHYDTATYEMILIESEPNYKHVFMKNNTFFIWFMDCKWFNNQLVVGNFSYATNIPENEQEAWPVLQLCTLMDFLCDVVLR